MNPYSKNPFEDNNNDNLNNPFANEDDNENYSNPFQAELKDDNDNNNKNNNYCNKENTNNNNDINNNNNFNPYEEENNNNPNINQNDNNNYNNNNNFNPYEEANDNNHDNPFENNNKYNPFENNFEDNNNNFNNNNNENNDNQRLPSFQNFEENTLNPYLNNNNNFNNNNFNENNLNNINYNNNQANNFHNNFGGPMDNQNIPPNPFGNDNPYNNNQGKHNNAEDAKRIKAIMDKCLSLYKQSSNQYENFNIKEAIKTLCKSIKGLDGLRQTILNKKTSFNSLLPKITSLRNKAFSNLQEYRINIYELIHLKFRPVPYKETEQLQDFVKRYLLTEPFISFEDIFDPAFDESKKLKFVMNDYFKKSQRMGYKNLLLYGPRGSGKTLAVHALAYDLKAKVAQLEGLELFKIPYFAKELARYAFGYMQFKPLIVYIKNIEQMFSNMSYFNYLYDKTSSSSLKDIIFIASTTIPVQQLHKDISSKFHYVYCIRPADKSHKYDYIKFISEKLGIKINMSEQELNTFAFQNLNNYSNEDIFNLIKAAIEIKKNTIGNNEQNQAYKEGLNENDIIKAFNSVRGNLTPEIMKYYYL